MAKKTQTTKAAVTKAAANQTAPVPNENVTAGENTQDKVVASQTGQTHPESATGDGASAVANPPVAVSAGGANTEEGQQSNAPHNGGDSGAPAVTPATDAGAADSSAQAGNEAGSDEGQQSGDTQGDNSSGQPAGTAVASPVVAAAPVPAAPVAAPKADPEPHPGVVESKVYTVMSPLKHNGKVYVIGGTVLMTEAEAETLLSIGVLGELE